MWFRLASATFTTNLGKMSELSSTVRVNLDAAGFTISGDALSFDKEGSNQSRTYTLTLKSNYEIQNTVTASVSSGNATATISGGTDGVYTLVVTAATAPTSEVKVTVSGAVYVGTELPEVPDDGGDEPTDPTPDGTPTVTWTTGASLDASKGEEITSTSRSRTNTIQVSDLTGSITSGGAATKFLIACYSGTTYLGQVNATNNSGDLVKGSGQWINKQTLISKELLESKGATAIRMVVNSGSGGSTFIMNGTVLATTPYSTTTTLDYPFVVGTLTKETGKASTGSRARTDKYFTVDELGTSFTVTECKFIVACYTSDEQYLGQRSTASNISSADCLTTAQWLTAGTEITTAELFGSTAYILENSAITENQSTVEKVRFVAETPNTIPHLYIDGVKLTQ